MSERAMKVARELLDKLAFIDCGMDDDGRPMTARDGFWKPQVMLDTIAAALDAFQPEWLDISTAPKDGTWILCAAIHPRSSSDPSLTYWWVATGQWSDRWNKFWDGVEPSGFNALTSWMPLPILPAPPQKDATDE